MGTVVNFETADTHEVARGIRVASLIDRQSTELRASLISVARGARYEAAVPAGCDQYVFVIGGEARIDGSGRQRMAIGPQTFGIVQEGVTFTLTGISTDAARVLSVLVPPPGAPRATPGFREGLKVMAVKDLPVVDVPEEKKRRVYLANQTTVGSGRGHVMIVQYTADTVTRKHHHPNAESLFVILNGRVRFLINDREETIGAGQAAHFPINDRHGLRSADGRELSFLEFHIPGSYATAWDE